MDMTLVRGREHTETFVGGNYDMDVKVHVGLRFSASKGHSETENDTLQMLLKTDRQKQLYRQIRQISTAQEEGVPAAHFLDNRGEQRCDG